MNDPSFFFNGRCENQLLDKGSKGTFLADPTKVDCACQKGKFETARKIAFDSKPKIKKRKESEHYLPSQFTEARLLLFDLLVYCFKRELIGV